MAATERVEGTRAVSLSALLDAGEGVIVTLAAGDTRLAVHKAVLASRSPVFEAMFQHGMLEESRGQVTISDMEGPVLRQLMEYVYTLRVPQLDGIAPELLTAADKYGMSGLKAACEEQMSTQLAVENAAATAVFALRLSCPSLAEAAVAFIKANRQVMASQGWADAVRTHPEEVVELSRLVSEIPAEIRMLPAEEKDKRLVQAAQDGEVEAVRMLLAAGAHAGATDWGGTSTALHYAAERGYVEAARALLESGAHVDARDCEQSTPLHWAAFNGRAASVRLLAAASADVNARNFDRRTPLHDAARRGHPEATKALLDVGADLEATGGGGICTALHFAAEKGYLEIVRILLDRGAEVDSRDSQQSTPLHWAAYNGRAAVVRMLAAHSADRYARNSHGRTPLHDAARRGHAEAATALLEVGADREARDHQGATPLDLLNSNYQQLVQVFS